MKYYRIDVEMTTGFKYHYTCAAKQLEGMKKSSESHWTKSIEVTEITKKEHEEYFYATYDNKLDKVLRKSVVRSSKVVSKGELKPKSKKK
jgi:hypothetical protein